MGRRNHAMIQKRVRDAKRNVVDGSDYGYLPGWTYEDWLRVYLEAKGWQPRIRIRDKIWLMIEGEYLEGEKAFKENFDRHVKELALDGVIDRLEDENGVNFLRWIGRSDG